MRAQAAAVLLLLAAAAAAPALLVLRAACHRPMLYDDRRLQRHAAASLRPALPSFRILSYNETCGPGWEVRVARRALSTLGAGGAVVASGGVGRACGVLRAAARSLAVPAPRACLAPHALAASLLLLLTRFHWSRALLPPPLSASECSETLQETSRLLVRAGLEVRVAPLSTEEFSRKPHVVILCASDRSVEAAARQLDSTTVGSSAALLIHAPELDAGDSHPGPTYDQFHEKSNINLAIRSSPYVDERENSSYSTQVSFFTKFLTLVSDYATIYKRSLSPSPPAAALAVNNLIVSHPQTRHVSEYNNRRSIGIFLGGKENITNEKQEIEYIRYKKLISSVNETRSNGTLVNITRVNNVSGVRRRRRRRNSTARIRDINYTLPEREKLTQDTQPITPIMFKLFEKRIFLICNKDLNTKEMILTEKSIYDDIIESLERENEVTGTRIDSNVEKIFLYESQPDKSGWKYLATFSAAWNLPLEFDQRWEINAEITNTSEEFRWWSKVRWEQEQSDGIRVGVLLGMCGVVVATLGLAAAAAVGVRVVAARRRGRRRRADVVLAPTELTFPPDERRRLGEGMETMLSCWLQQLHEFGGPELERPDLLMQPTPAPAPSVPSSTCSVNRVPPDRRIRYKGDAVHVRYLPTEGPLELRRRRATDSLLVLQALRHENLNPFIGITCEPRPALVFDYCGRGSLEDVLVADDIKLDWTFRLSLLTDLVKGMRYLHGSSVRVHGRLSSRNVVVDSRWVLRLTDYGLSGFYRAAGIPDPPRTPRELLWTAPELLREMRGVGNGGPQGARGTAQALGGNGGGQVAGRGGTQAGDVFSFAIIMQEVIVRGEPYCMLSLRPEEIIEKLLSPPPLIRPSVSMGAAPPEAVSVMRQCWAESPDLRPDFTSLHDIFRHLHRGRKINIVDSMFEMLEKYSNNLEELIKERTDQLDMEKKKTEQLLNRMLPRSVAERLLLGSRVEPEEFEEVTIYFSDIVGFTSLAARSTPVQVVDLLNDLYTTFDAAIEQYSVYKVETIGDAYMVVGGLPVRRHAHAEAVATMALHLLSLAGRFRVRHRPASPLYLRSGVHTGPCCAGVVGLTMPRYCLFGDTVNTASRMESTGAAWRIQVSATTAERLMAAGGYRLRSRGLTQIKGKGAMHTYWLLGKDGFDKQLPTPPALETVEVLYESDGENESEVSSIATAVTETVPDDKSTTTKSNNKEWQRSGAVSADCSPPARAQSQCNVYISSNHSAPYSRYRCMPGGGRVLRRQWSLERGEALAAAAGARSLPAAPLPAPLPAPPHSPPREPLALRAPPPRSHHKYRTRPDAARPSSFDEDLFHTE